jgi:hypothetical protein
MQNNLHLFGSLNSAGFSLYTNLVDSRTLVLGDATRQVKNQTLETFICLSKCFFDNGQEEYVRQDVKSQYHGDKKSVPRYRPNAR